MSQDPINTAKAQALKESWASVDHEIIRQKALEFKRTGER